MNVLKYPFQTFLRSSIGLNHVSLYRRSTIAKEQQYSTFLLQRQNRRNIFLSNLYSADSSGLVKSPIELKYLVPNIFTEELNTSEYPKIKVKDKTHNHFINSYLSIALDLSKSEGLKNQLKRFTEKQVRIGRLLEIMDMMAGLVSYRHCFGSFKKPNPFVLVTGSIQSIELFQQINCFQDIKIEGSLNHVGKTSMQVVVNIFQNNQLKANSFFTMVSRNSSDLSKGYPCPSLDTSELGQKQSEKAQFRKKKSIGRSQRRKIQISESFDKSPPNSEEIAEIHDLFLRRKSKPHLFTGVTIESTKTQNNLLMHVQDRNVHEKIFGGFLMREMLQTGFFAANKFLIGTDWWIEAMTDIYFLSAVQVGHGLTISASVTYNQTFITIVTVEAFTTSFKTGQKKLCCTCQIVLATKSQSSPSSSLNKQFSVYPHSYDEALKYLVSKRTFERLFATEKKD